MKVVRHLTLTLEYADGASDGAPEWGMPATLTLRAANAAQIAEEVVEALIARVHQDYHEETGFLDAYFFAGLSLLLSDDDLERYRPVPTPEV